MPMRDLMLITEFLNKMIFVLHCSIFVAKSGRISKHLISLASSVSSNLHVARYRPMLAVVGHALGLYH